TIVSAGHGAKVALTLIEDAVPEYYHDWVAPEGYFTNRGREVPLGCEEIPQEERLKRDEKARQRIMDYVENPLGEEPVPHPSLQD
ncbi:MAG: thioredoxin reductase, partial [Halobacteria archaeon]|nr:thioredoxin reductase [Halobacteria archaeon]